MEDEEEEGVEWKEENKQEWKRRVEGEEGYTTPDGVVWKGVSKQEVRAKWSYVEKFEELLKSYNVSSEDKQEITVE